MDSQNPKSTVPVTNVPINYLGEILGVPELDVVINQDISLTYSSWDLLLENPTIVAPQTIQFGEVDPSIVELAKKSVSSHQELPISNNVKEAFSEIQDRLAWTSW